MPHVDYVLNEGIQPHFNEDTQECVPEYIDGVKFWKITSYTIEEINDGSEKMKHFMLKIVHDKVDTLNKLQENEVEWNKLSGSTQHNLIAYKNHLMTLDDFPKGFTIPNLPPVDLSPITNIKLLGSLL
jgi:hypothetical protein